MQDQAMRLRLSQLKKASIELKSKVYQQPRIDSDTVVEILSNVLPNNFKYNQSQLNSQKINTSQNTPAPIKVSSINQSLNYSPNNSSIIFPISNPQNKIQKGIRRSTNSSDASIPSKDVDRQIDRFKQLNEQLQNQLANIDKQIADLKKIQQTKEQQSWKQHLPFVRKQDKLGLFITKLSIKQYDFDKIDYETHYVKLFNDTLLIENTRNFKKQFKMANLQYVKYIGDKCMKIQFKSQQIVSIFIQFNKTEHRNQWDHAFYINSKIITSKDLDKSLFIQEKEHVNSVKSKSKSSLKLSDASQNDNTKDDPKLKGSNRLTDRFVQRSNASFASSRKKSEEFKSITQLQYTLNGHSPDGFEQPTSNLNNSSFVSAGSKREKQIKDFNVFGEGITESKINESRPNTSKFNHGEVNFEQLQFNPNFFQQKKAQESNVTENDTKTNPITKLQTQIQSLKQGFFFVKYAKDGYKPHNKKIFISSEQDVLICANSEDLNDRRVIPIETIKTVKYPFMGDGIKKHIKNPRVENYCAIEYSAQGNPKCLQLGCQKVHFIKRFYTYLSSFLKQRGILFTD